MPQAPSTDNYTLGRGVVYFDKLDPATGLYEGERDMGNANAFALSVAAEKLDHFNYRSGLRSKDKTVVLEITPTVTFTLDEPNVENVALAFMGEITEVSQSADDDVSLTFDAVALDRYFSLGDYRGVFVTTLPFDNLSGTFTVGETITGGTSSATAVVLRVDATQLVINTVAGGPFQDDEQITGGTSAATADVNSATGEVTDATDIVLSDGSSTYYTKGTDYTVDSATGRVKVLSGGSITAGDTLTAEFEVGAQTYSTINAIQETSIEGRLRFVPDNPVGTEMELLIWRADLVLSGEVAMIGDEWQVMEFTGEVLKDETGHPTEPYMRIITADTV